MPIIHSVGKVICSVESIDRSFVCERGVIAHNKSWLNLCENWKLYEHIAARKRSTLLTYQNERIKETQRRIKRIMNINLQWICAISELIRMRCTSHRKNTHTAPYLVNGMRLWLSFIVHNSLGFECAGADTHCERVYLHFAFFFLLPFSFSLSFAPSLSRLFSSTSSLCRDRRNTHTVINICWINRNITTMSTEIDRERSTKEPEQLRCAATDDDDAKIWFLNRK